MLAWGLQREEERNRAEWREQVLPCLAFLPRNPQGCVKLQSLPPFSDHSTNWDQAPTKGPSKTALEWRGTPLLASGWRPCSANTWPWLRPG